MTGRPSVAVIVPFSGSDEQLRRCRAALGRLAVEPGDELIVADNRPGGRGALDAGAVRVLPAAGLRAAGFARNRAASVVRTDWLVFIDADTVPCDVLLERYFQPPPRASTAIIAGAIVDRPGGATLAARHSADRSQMSQRVTLQRIGTPYAQSANVAVRRTAFAAVGGFDEGARSGEDADLCFRLRGAGWGLEERPLARVEHLTRATLAELLAQLARHGCGAAWLERRYPGEFPAPRSRQLAGRAARGLMRAIAAAARGRREQAAVELLEVAEASAFVAGRLLLSNRPRRSLRRHA